MTEIREKQDRFESPWTSIVLRFLPALVIVAGALAWYGSYWRCWFNPHDEGGTVCLVAQRLMAGERPWVDVEPGYNIGWFFPVMGLFHFTGVNYLAARAFFFALATFTALIGCGIVTRISGSRWLGLATGLALVVLPGSQFKDYIPLAEAANTACLVFMTRVDPGSARRWLGSVALGGLTLGLTFAVRVELGFFFLFLWLGVLLFFFLDGRISVGRRAARFLAGLACLTAAILVPLTPAYLFCRSEGVASQFVAVYVNWARFIERAIAEKVGVAERLPTVANPPSSTPAPAAASASAPAAVSVPSATPSPAVSSPLSPAVESMDSSTLQRAPLSGIWRARGRNWLLPFLTYAPILSFAIFLLLAMAGLARSLWRREFTLASTPMQWMILMGGSLTTFPQFFFFRPDRPHLSEFMPGFIIAMAGSLWLLWPRQKPSGILHCTAAWIFAAMLTVHFLAFFIFAFEHASAGTQVARRGRKTRFDAANGVNVFVTAREAQILAGVRDSVLKYSRPEDYVVCFPYMPGYNLLTNRRTYVRNVYVDNATRSSTWSEDAIQEFETKRPAVVIIDDRKINGLDASRFSRWAAKAYTYLKQNYTRVARLDDNTIEVFALTAPTLQNQSPPP